MAAFAAMLVLAGLLAAAAFLAGCGPSQAADSRPLVVTTIPVIYSLTVNVAGDAVRVQNLLPPGASPHQVSFTPQDAKLITEADLLIQNGGGLERWLDGLVRSAGTDELQMVVASAGVEFLRANEPVPVPGSVAEHDAEDVDPHVWLDARNAQQMVANIRDGLKRLQPERAEDFDRRATAYLDRLASLHAEIQARTATFAHQDFVAFHGAFQYYARAYGLRQVAVLEEFPGKEPSARYLAGIVDLVRETGVQAVFAEPQFSSRPAEALAREAGVGLYTVDPEGAALTATGYEDLMRSNTEVFAQALGA